MRLRRSASAGALAWSATSSAVRFACEPPLTSTPAASGAKPVSSPSQRSTRRSISVAAGEDRHAVTFWFAADASRSAAMPTGDAGDRT